MRILAGMVGIWMLAVLAAEPVQAQETPASETYVVRPDDTLYSIARRFGTSVEQLRRLNDLLDNTIRVGQELVVRPPVAAPSPTPDTADTTAASDTTEALPARPRPQAPPADTGRSLSAFGRIVPAEETLAEAPIDRLAHGAYVLRPGDTFFSVAARYGTTADSLFALNDEHTAPLPPGKVLRLPERFALPAHVVAESDSTIYEVAARYGVSVRALQRANDLEDIDIEEGQRLRIPGRSAPEPGPPDALPDPVTHGPVAVFPETYVDRLTASGTRYDPDALVVSHPALPFGSIVLLTNPATERSTFARVIDRGPVDEAVLVDVSTAVAERLGLASGSEQPVALRVVQ